MVFQQGCFFSVFFGVSGGIGFTTKMSGLNLNAVTDLLLEIKADIFQIFYNSFSIIL